MIGIGWKSLISIIFPSENSWFLQKSVESSIYSEVWMQNHLIPKGLQFEFEVHKMNNGRKPQNLEFIHSSASSYISKEDINGKKFITFKSVSKKETKYKIKDIGRFVFIYQLILQS